ncbi:MAG TPA: hypothetical protein VGX91_13875 [Candidatus Cybelea sp.]|jgi:hypothetical protein|nr:hypothetical protein [Candidatus Cybelea sp.]
MKHLHCTPYSATIVVGILLSGCGSAGSQVAAPSRLTPLQVAILAQRDYNGYNQYAYVRCGDCRCLWGCNTGCGNNSNKRKGDEWVLVDKDCDGVRAGSIYAVALLDDNRDSKIAYAGLSNGTVRIAKWTKDRYTKAGILKGLTGIPTGIAGDFKGNVWVTNSPSATLSEFHRGAKSPSKTYTDPNLASLSYVAVDRRNAVYVEGQSRASGGIEVDELQAGGTFKSLSASNQLGYTPGGLAVIATGGKAGYIFVNDQGTPNGPPTITQWLLSGERLIKEGSFGYSGIDTALSVDPSGKDTAHVWAANNVSSSTEFATSAVEYAFPSGGVVAATPTTISSSESFGVAITDAP